MATHSHSRHQGVVLAPPAEDLCLAFANTRFWRGRDTPNETLNGFGDVLAWLEKNGGAPLALVTRARHWGSDHPIEAAAAASEAIALRETIYHLFSAVADDGKLAERDLATLNNALANTPPRLRLSRGERGLGWAAEAVAPTVPTLLAPVLWSAADLLIYAGNRRLRRCANDECLWLFMDHSKGGTRRWCDMNSCGNRAKARRHYLKHKGE
jgi:predicted RNA-binding Zn ribbon-like protein